MADSPSILAPVAITCSTRDCQNDKHYFRHTVKTSADGKVPTCPGCETKVTDLIDWDRTRRQNIDDIKYVCDAMSKEFIRHHFWHVEIDEVALAHARRKGRVGL